MKPSPTLYSFGFICTQEKIEAVQRRPAPAEQDAIEAYREKYKEAMGRFPHGLHYLPLPGNTETVPVWLAPAD